MRRLGIQFERRQRQAGTASSGLGNTVAVTVVLLPAIGLDAACWDWIENPDIATAIKPTYPGFGTAPAAPRDYTLAELADAIAHDVPGVFDVVGVSMGGMVAQQLALRHPERVRSLFLAGTTGTVQPTPVLERANLSESDRMAELTDLVLRLWFSPAFLSQYPEPDALQYAHRSLSNVDRWSFARGWRAISQHSVLEALSKIQAPTTCVAGDQDQSTPPNALAQIHARVAGSRLDVRHGPHLMQLERPDEFSRALTAHFDWLRTMPAPG